MILLLLITAALVRNNSCLILVAMQCLSVVILVTIGRKIVLLVVVMILIHWLLRQAARVRLSASGSKSRRIVTTTTLPSILSLVVTIQPVAVDTNAIATEIKVIATADTEPAAAALPFHLKKKNRHNKDTNELVFYWHETEKQKRCGASPVMGFPCCMRGMFATFFVYSGARTSVLVERCKSWHHSIFNNT